MKLTKMLYSTLILALIAPGVTPVLAEDLVSEQAEQASERVSAEPASEQEQAEFASPGQTEIAGYSGFRAADNPELTDAQFTAQWNAAAKDKKGEETEATNKYKWFIDGAGEFHISKGIFMHMPNKFRSTDLTKPNADKTIKSIAFRQKITSAGNLSFAFAGITELTIIKGAERLDTSGNKITNLKGIFSNDTKLQKVWTEGWQVGKVGDFSYAFLNTPALEYAKVANWRPANAYYMGHMFENSGTRELDPSKWGDMPNLTETYFMFKNVKNLPSLNLGEWNTGAKLTKTEEMFNGFGGTSLVLSPRFDTSHVTNFTRMFANMKNIVTMDAATKSLKTTSATNMYEMFALNDKLTAVNVASFDTSKVTTFWGMFRGTPALKTVNISNFNFASADTIQSMFHTSGIESIDLSKMNTSNVTNFSNVFAHSKLKSADISTWDMSKAATTDSLFADTPITSVKLGAKNKFPTSTKIFNDTLATSEGYTGYFHSGEKDATKRLHWNYASNYNGATMAGTYVPEKVVSPYFTEVAPSLDLGEVTVGDTAVTQQKLNMVTVNFGTTTEFDITISGQIDQGQLYWTNGGAPLQPLTGPVTTPGTGDVYGSRPMVSFFAYKAPASPKAGITKGKITYTVTPKVK